MEIIIVFVLGYVVGWVMGIRRMKIALREHMLRQMPDILVHELPQLSTERIGPSIMLYDKASFLCQGNSIEDLARDFLKLKNIKIAQVLHDEQDIWFIDGEVCHTL